jgi:hypothetical protein
MKIRPCGSRVVPCGLSDGRQTDSNEIANYNFLPLKNYRHFSSNTKAVGRSLDR